MQNALTSESIPFLLILAGAVFVHACFQLSVSVLTRLSSHTIGAGKSHRRLLVLALSYVLGVVVATTSVTLGVAGALAWLSTLNESWPAIAVISFLPVAGLLVILFYYRPSRGTTLWLPRPFVDYLMERAKKTRSGVEAGMLGAATVVGELPFILAPVGLVGLMISFLAPSTHWLVFSGAYSLLVSLPLVFLMLYISSGHKISAVQNWRERNKTFLQWTSGIALIILSAYIVSYVTRGPQ